MNAATVSPLPAIRPREGLTRTQAEKRLRELMDKILRALFARLDLAVRPG